MQHAFFIMQQNCLRENRQRHAGTFIKMLEILPKDALDLLLIYLHCGDCGDCGDC